jgi:di/tricarboxylate transporter
MKRHVLSLLGPLLIVGIRPFGLTLSQSVLLGALVMTIIWWTTNWVDKTYASLFLIGVFLLFGSVSYRTVFTFPLSSNFVLIVFSFIFSQGIANSRLTDKLIQPVLARHVTTLWRLMVMIFALQFAMIFIIPQPFSRIILIALLFKEFFEKSEMAERAKETLLFWVYGSTVFVNMTMVRGDIILNNALMGIANYSIDAGTWSTYMAVPSLLLYLLSATGFVVVFRKTLLRIDITSGGMDVDERHVLDKQDKIRLAIILGTVGMWSFEWLHGLSGTKVVMGGTALMFAVKLLRFKDLKSVNVSLMIFLTAAFSIGGVLKESGTSDALLAQFLPLFPGTFNYQFIGIVLFTSTVLHMVLGSIITTFSVVLPVMMVVGHGLVPSEILLFMIYVMISGHFVLPFHNVILVIGNGNRHFLADLMLKYAPFLTGAVLFSILFVYLNWWRMIGAL